MLKNNFPREIYFQIAELQSYNITYNNIVIFYFVIF